MNPGDRVFVSECGHGARAGRVRFCYDREGTPRVLVDLDDMPPRDCFATSVHSTAAEAEKGAQ